MLSVVSNLAHQKPLDKLWLWLLFGVNEKLLSQHISGPITKYKLLYVSNWVAGLGLGLGVRDRERARHCLLVFDLAKVRDHLHRRATHFITNSILGMAPLV